MLISHRGNLEGPNSCVENHPDCIRAVLQAGYDCEVDIWVKSGIIHLGHDEPLYRITKNFLINNQSRLWIHCKNIEALIYCRENLRATNYFFHNEDKVILTSQGFLWHYPDCGPYGNQSICVLPEWIYWFPDSKEGKIPNCYGICSDYIKCLNYQKNT